MSRYSSYEPYAGGFRATLAAAILQADVGKIRGYGFDANGRAVVGGGQSGVKAIGIANQPFAAGDQIDLMTAGEIGDATLADLTTALTVGTTYYAAASDGAISTTNTGKEVGVAVLATHPTGNALPRLIVRVK